MDGQQTPPLSFHADAQQSQSPPVALEPTHPFECLRLIELPACVVCGEPTRFYCGGCLASPAFCSPEHFLSYWPTHSRCCERDASFYTAAAAAPGGDTRALHPYPKPVTLYTRSAVSPPISLEDVRIPLPPANPGGSFDYVVDAFYAKYDALNCTFLRVNMSPVPALEGNSVKIQDCFDSAAQIRSFVVRRDASLRLLDTPFHIFYCAKSYAGRQDPNHPIKRLTESKDPLSLHTWYGPVVVLKFASRACRSYGDMTAIDVVALRDYLALFG